MIYGVAFESCCLSHALSRAVHIDDEVTVEGVNALIMAIGRLLANISESNGVRLDNKLKVYKTVVPPTILYTCET